MSIDRENFERWMNFIVQRLDKIEQMLNRMTNIKSCLEGDELIDNQDMRILLGVTTRTLQRYRDLNMIPFYKIDGRIYYKKSEVMEIFKNRIMRGDKSSDKEGSLS